MALLSEPGSLLLKIALVLSEDLYCFCSCELYLPPLGHRCITSIPALINMAYAGSMRSTCWWARARAARRAAAG